MSEVLEAIRKRLSDDFKSQGYEVMLLQELRELKRSKVADIVSSYCNFMKVHEIDALMDELDDTMYIGTKKALVEEVEKALAKATDTIDRTIFDREELKAPPELAAIGLDEERKKRGKPRVVKEVIREEPNGEPIPKPPAKAARLETFSMSDEEWEEYQKKGEAKPSLDKLLDEEG
jgi:hypothetical protein